ncbi:unnamed protein product [Symbiodinium natans]|uniref:Uncharacterized protein n=1 Tax=Symbiodinium natans TaxID=878477 RepID=A0A812FWK3_9DINO|nr:unnamed protein product [Symbiodinium natans]
MGCTSSMEVDPVLAAPGTMISKKALPLPQATQAPDFGTHKLYVKTLNQYLQDVESHPREFETVVAVRRAAINHFSKTLM